MAWLPAFLGGLAGLLWGFRLLSAGLGAAAGGRLAAALRWAGRGRLRALLAGATVTAAVQSSSLTTIFLVSCVDAGLLSVEEAAPLVMGANVGTTVTAHLLATAAGLPALPVAGAALVASGVATVALRRRAPVPAAGRALTGAGLLLLALEALGRGLAPLAGAPWFAGLLEAVGERPLLGVLAGVVLTAAVLSSGITVGLLQQLAASGLISLRGALPVLFGDDIGTTADTLLAGLAGGRQARAAALVHLLFNLAQTALFLPAVPWVAARLSALPAGPARQIAVAHSLFNAATALLLLPLSSRLARVARRLAGC